MSFWFDKSVSRWKIRIVRTVSGRRREVARTLPAGVTRAQAEEEHTACVRILYDTAHGKLQDRPLSEAVLRYLEEEAPKLKSFRAIENHMQQLLPWIEGRALSQIGEVADEYSEANTHLAPATIKQRLAYLGRIANLAHKEWKPQWLAAPIYIQGPTVNNKRMVVPERSHLEAIMGACRFQETSDAILVAMFTAMREGEIWKIGRDYRILRDVIEIPPGQQKNDDPGYIPILPEFKKALSRFPLQIHPRTVLRDLQETGAALGYPHYIFHDIRRTTASLILEAGYSLEVVGQVLRHKNIQTTRGYAYLQTKAKKEAVERAFGVGKFAPKRKKAQRKALKDGGESGI